MKRPLVYVGGERGDWLMGDTVGNAWDSQHVRENNPL